MRELKVGSSGKPEGLASHHHTSRNTFALRCWRNDKIRARPEDNRLARIDKSEGSVLVVAEVSMKAAQEGTPYSEDGSQDISVYRGIPYC